MTKRTYLDYLNDIVTEIALVLKFIKGMTFDDFKGDEKTIHACIRSLEVIGEASKQIPIDIKELSPDIPWKEMSGMRDVLIHDYFGVNEEIIWNVINNRLIELYLTFKR